MKIGFQSYELFLILHDILLLNYFLAEFFRLVFLRNDLLTITTDTKKNPVSKSNGKWQMFGTGHVFYYFQGLAFLLNTKIMLACNTLDTAFTSFL